MYIIPALCQNVAAMIDEFIGFTKITILPSVCTLWNIVIKLIST